MTRDEKLKIEADTHQEWLFKNHLTASPASSFSMGANWQRDQDHELFSVMRQTLQNVWKEGVCAGALKEQLAHALALAALHKVRGEE